MPVPVGHQQLSGVFFFFSLETSIVLKHQPKIKSPHRLHLNVKKKLAWLLTDIMVEKRLIVTNDQKSCKRLLICGSQCICSSVLGCFASTIFIFQKSSGNCSFSILSELLGLPSREWYHTSSLPKVNLH